MKSKSRTDTATPHSSASIRRVGANSAHKDTQRNTTAWIGGVKAKVRTHTHTPQSPTREGGVEAESAPKRTHPNTPCQE